MKGLVRWLVLSVSLFFVILRSAPAQSIETGNDLQETCKTYNQPVSGNQELARVTYCAGFVSGLLGVGQLLKGDLGFCVPRGVTIGQATAVLLKFLAEHPEHTHNSATALTIIAFSNQWTCK